jgi:hypothetical protein
VALVDLDEAFHLGISGNIHDQVHAMVVYEIFHPVSDWDTEVFRPRESGRGGISIGDSDDFNRRNQVEEIEERGPSSSGSEDRDLGLRELRRHRSVRQRLHGMTPWMEGRDRPSPTSYQWREV